jgi:uncharacterized protein YgiM (DUF1202 family)
MTKLNVAFLSALCLAGAALAETMRVQVQSGQVRGTPSFLGQVVATLPYGQAVETAGAQGPWLQVRTPDGKAGWMHSSALTTKRISAQTGGAAVSTGASGDELALAGKGFSADVEAQFKAQHAEIDFSWVDKMVKMNASPAQLASFAKAGGLKQNGGAQ